MMTPETTNYMIAGYSVFLSIFSIYILSLVIRWSRLKKNMQLLQELDLEE